MAGHGRRRKAQAVLVLSTALTSWFALSLFERHVAGARTPGVVVGAFVTDRIAGRWDEACSGFAPKSAASASCTQQAVSADTGLSYAGTVSVVSFVVKGDEALVAVTGKLCVSDSKYKGLTRCVSNAQPALGMPGKGLSFASAYAHTLSSSGRAFSPWPCQKTAGVWYLSAMAS
jgi:hypothetical protein